MRSATAPAAVLRALFVLSFLRYDVLPVVNAQTDEQNFFENPSVPGPNQAFSANPTWRIGSTQTIQWKTNYENYTMNLWQQQPDLLAAANGPGPTVFSKANYDRDADQFDWVVQTFNFDLSESDVFFLWITTPDMRNITSHYFNISKGDTSSSATSSTFVAPSTSSASATASVTSPAAQATSSSQNDEDSGMSSGIKIGVGVGVGLGVAILILLSVVVALMLKKRKKRLPPPSAIMSYEANRSFLSQPPPQVYSQEMEGNKAPIVGGKKAGSGWGTVELE